MNCKPGDLAVITHSSNHGRLVRVLERTAPLSCVRLRWLSGTELSDWWDCEALTSMTTWTDRENHEGPGAVASIPDTYLRPIRDPGDSARDNAWDWLPAVPTKELA